MLAPVRALSPAGELILRVLGVLLKQLGHAEKNPQKASEVTHCWVIWLKRDEHGELKVECETDRLSLKHP